MSHYLLSRKAEDDLIAIYRYSYLTFDERQADLYVGSLEQACQLLADYPLMNRERDEFTPPVRIHHHQKHLIIYQVESEGILIIRFLHGRMDIENHLEDDHED